MDTYYAVLDGNVAPIRMIAAEVEWLRADPDREKSVYVPHRWPLQEVLYGDTIYDTELEALEHWLQELDARRRVLRSWLAEAEDDHQRASEAILRCRFVKAHQITRREQTCEQ